MTPADHYAQAEHLLAEADKLPDHDSPAARAYELVTATAQVHATLDVATAVRDVTRRLVELSGRLARFEPVDDDELARFAAARDALVGGADGER